MFGCLHAVVIVMGVHPLNMARGPTKCPGSGSGDEEEGEAYLRFSFQALYHLMNLLVLCSLGCRQCS